MAVQPTIVGRLEPLRRILSQGERVSRGRGTIDMNYCKGRSMLAATLSLALIACLAGNAAALDYITVNQSGKQTDVVGKVQVEAEDGGVLLLARDGVLWPVPKEELVSRRTDDLPFTPLSREELSKKLLAELPDGFKIHPTKHYLICYNTSPAYATWVGGLFERLLGAFTNYWTRRGFELHEPEFPLVAIVFDRQSSYAQYSREEIGEGGASNIIGYYSLRSNRVIMYDLTGVEEVGGKGERTSAGRINQILSQPRAERTVATIVHESTHQIAFNSGLQVRYADIPFWVSEGIAIYFETPDLQSTKGWRNIGGVNQVNLFNFRKSLRERPEGSLKLLLTDDKRFRDPATMSNAYAESWALNYFLLRTRAEKYVAYLKQMSEQAPLVPVSPEQRLADFQKALGEDLGTLDAEFLRYMRAVD
jgi:hypothetical protein